MNKKIYFISLFCLMLDQIVKIVVISKINLNQSIDIIKNFFSITYVRNYGAAWSILQGNTFFLISVAILSILIIYNFFIKNNLLKSIEVIMYGMLIGGILGNLIDRIIYNYVIDFLDFNIFGYKFPVFNIADIFIVLSAGLMILMIVMEDDKNEKIRN